MLGALQCFLDRYGTFDAVEVWIGTSIGSVLSYLLMLEFPPLEILTFLFEHAELLTEVNGQTFHLLDFLESKGISQFTTIEHLLEEMTRKKSDHLLTMKELHHRVGKQWVVPTYNLSKRKMEYLSATTHPDLPCLTAIRMSCAVPFLFPPCTHENESFMDGAVSDHFCVHKVPHRYLPRQVWGVELITNWVGGDYGSLRQRKGPFPRQDQDGKAHEGGGISAMGFMEYLWYVLSIPFEEFEKYKRSSYRFHGDIVHVRMEYKFLFHFSMTSKEKLDLFSKGYSSCGKRFRKVVERESSIFPPRRR